MPLARPVAVTRMRAKTRFAPTASRRSMVIVGTSVGDVREEAADAFATVVRTSNVGYRGNQLDVLRAAGEVPVDIPLVDRRDGPLDQLHVLLRHRPWSINLWASPALLRATTRF